MKARRKLFATIGVVLGAGAALAACDLATNGVAADGDASSDGAIDVSADAPDGTEGDASSEGSSEAAASDGGDGGEAGFDSSTGPIACATVPTGVTNCASCPGFPSLCPMTGGCVSSCHDQCDGGPIECFACGIASPPIISSCLAAGGTCPAPSPYGPCPCPGNAVSLCPGDAQVCNSNSCIACGESSSDGKACHSQNCKNGGGDNPRYVCN